MVIETERLLLRKPMLADFDEYWLMKNDKAATQYTGEKILQKIGMTFDCVMEDHETGVVHRYQLDAANYRA